MIGIEAILMFHTFIDIITKQVLYRTRARFQDFQKRDIPDKTITDRWDGSAGE